MTNLNHEVAKKSFIGLFIRLFGKVLTFATSIVVARMIGAKILGEYTYFYTFFVIISYFPLLGMSSGLNKFVPQLLVEKKFRQVRSLVGFCNMLTLGLALLTMLILYLFREPLVRHVLRREDMELFIACIPLIALITLKNVNRGIFSAKRHVIHNSLPDNVLSPAFKLLSILVLILFVSSPIRILVISSNIMFGGMVLYDFVVMLKNREISFPRRSDAKSYLQIVKFGFVVFSQCIIEVFTSNIDILMIGLLTVDANVGVYQVALSVAILNSFFLSSVNSVFTPVMSELSHQKKFAELKAIYSKTTKAILIFSSLFVCEVALFSNEIMSIFGKEFEVGSVALILLTVGQLVNSGTGSAGEILMMCGYPKYMILINTICVVLSVALNYTLIPAMGLEGAACAAMLAVAVTNLLRLYFVKKKLRITPYDRSFLRIFTAPVLSFLSILSLKNMTKMDWRIEFGVFSLGLVILYFALTWMFGLTEAEKTTIAHAARKFGDRLRAFGWKKRLE